MHTLENKNQKGGINVADNKVIENPYKGLEIVDGHADHFVIAALHALRRGEVPMD